MLIYIITISILSICAIAFRMYWKSVLKFCYYLLKRAIDVVKKIITSIKRQGKAIFFIYKMYRNKRITKSRVHITEEEIDIDLLPQEFQDILNNASPVQEVINRTNDIDPSEFE